MLTTVLIATMGVGFTSCGEDNKDPKQDLTLKIIGKKWYATIFYNSENYVLFREDGTYSLALGAETLGGSYYNEMNINGMYSIKEIEETQMELGGDFRDATLFKMLASGSNDFDQLWVYHYIGPGDRKSIMVYFYSGNELVRGRGFTESLQ